jgi:hypothetical protein
MAATIRTRRSMRLAVIGNTDARKDLWVNKTRR